MLWYKTGNTLLKEIKEKEFAENLLPFWYIGQMGIVIKWNQKIIYIDPVLTDLTDEKGNTRRHYPAPYQAEYATADYIFCTHNHRDHMNQETLLGIVSANPNVKIIIPTPLKNELIAWGIPERHILTLSQNKTLEIEENISITGIETAHDSYQYDEQGNSLTLGYLFRFAGMKLFHSGDTMLTQKLLDTLKKYTPFHVLLLPINGSDILRDSKNIIGNMNAKDATILASELCAELTIPLHYDMVKGNEENPLLFAQYMEKLAPNLRYHIMRLGELFLLG